MNKKVPEERYNSYKKGEMVGYNRALIEVSKYIKELRHIYSFVGYNKLHFAKLKEDETKKKE